MSQKKNEFFWNESIEDLIKEYQKDCLACIWFSSTFILIQNSKIIIRKKLCKFPSFSILFADKGI